MTTEKENNEKSDVRITTLGTIICTSNYKLKQLKENNKHYEINLETLDKDYRKAIERCI